MMDALLVFAGLLLTSFYTLPHKLHDYETVVYIAAWVWVAVCIIGLVGFEAAQAAR
jgi:hypothetical protein